MTQFLRELLEAMRQRASIRDCLMAWVRGAVEQPTITGRTRLAPDSIQSLASCEDCTFRRIHSSRRCRENLRLYEERGLLAPAVAAASELGRVVTNGMSQYSRNERNANSGIVVGIIPADYPGHPLAGITFQRHWEERAFEAGGATYAAPAQRVGDFLALRGSTSLGEVVPSYKPGVRLTDLATCLPDFAVAAIREALPAFDWQIKGFALHDAMLTGVETRTSSPIRIRRDNTYQSLNTRGLYPAGEGAGYAGGILSAGVDGIRIAEAVALTIARTEVVQNNRL